MMPESLSSGLASVALRPAGAHPPAARTSSPLTAPEAGRLHELHAKTPADAPSTAAAALLMAATPPGNPSAPIAWLRTEAAERRGGRVHGPGLVALGIDPARLLLAVLPDDVAALKTAVELLRTGSMAALLLELHGAAPRLDLTTSRRLALAAAAGATPCLLLRIGSAPVPSAAWRRWSVASKKSLALAANAPGPPMIALELARDRSGPAAGRWMLEWRQGGWAPCVAPKEIADEPQHDEPLHPPALARVAFSLPGGRQAAPAWRRAG